MLNQSRRNLHMFRAPLLTALFLLPNACYVDATEGESDDSLWKKPKTSEVTYSSWESYPSSSTYEYFQCKATKLSLCGERPNLDNQYTWNSTCKGRDCSVLSVFAHYTLNENLGQNQTLAIEAFDNANFNGSPVASLAINGFDGSSPHSTEREEIYLAPGEYYFRAYIHSAQDPLVPYPLNGMDLVGERPVGVYGALSGAKRVVITKGQQATPIHINIDQLFKRPGSEPDTQAKLRVKFSLTSEILVPNDRQLHILFLKNPDYEEKPAYAFTISSNLLLTPSSDGSVEFVSPSLKPGAYYLFAYIDQDSDGLFDEGEAQAFYRFNEKIAPVTLEAEHTRTTSLLLQNTPVESSADAT